MIRKICDKCGKTINHDTISNATFPMFSISRIRSTQLGLESIDLCPECSRIFESWLEDCSMAEEVPSHCGDVIDSDLSKYIHLTEE